MANVRKDTVPQVGEDVEQLELTVLVGIENGKLMGSFKVCWTIFFPSDLAVPLLGVYRRERYMFTEDLMNLHSCFIHNSPKLKRTQKSYQHESMPFGNEKQ